MIEQSNQKNYQKIIFDVLGNRPIAFNPILAKATRSITAGLFLSQLLYWVGKENGQDGWIFKTIKEMEEETALTRKEQDGAIKKLKRLNVLQVAIRGIPAKRHFRINFDVLLELISSLSKRDKQVCTKGTNKFVQKGQTNTYNTTYNTSDIYKKIIKIKNQREAKANGEVVVLGNDVNSIIAKFKEVNPSYERLFKNLTQRQAAERLLKKYGKEWLEKLIAILPKVNSQPYAPRITTPYELEMKLGKLKIYFEQLKNNQKGGVMNL